jgi:hypothetical protein
LETCTIRVSTGLSFTKRTSLLLSSLAVVGDFSAYTGKSITDFIYESNQGKQVNFLKSLEEALERLSRG